MQVAELRADRRIQDRKLKDLEHQLAQIKVTTQTVEALPGLPVEVVAPPTVGEGQRLVGVADDGSEIVYEGDAALGKPAGSVDLPPRQTAMRDPDREVAKRPMSARATHVATRSDGGEAA